MGYKLETKWKGKTLKTKRTFRTKAAAKKFKEKRMAHFERIEKIAVARRPKALPKIERAEHAVMKARIVKVA